MNEWDITTPPQLTQEINPDASAPNIDYLIRMYGPSREEIKFVITGTEKFKRHFGSVFDYFKFVNDTLVEVIVSQKRSLDYNGFYNAFLMGQLSEEEFEIIAQKFTYIPRTIDTVTLSSKVNILFDLTNIDYSIAELADIFQCNNNTVTTAVQLITNNKLSGAVK